MARLGMVTLDSANARALAAWWAEQLDGKLVDEYDGEYCMVTGGPIVLGFQQVSDPTPGKNKAHFDLTANDSEGGRTGLVAAFVASGAKHIATRGEELSFQWDVLEDPDGNQFCIADHFE
ncbi:VOC family protein [Timonella sp. A28]|uniref:VOC family protein n=1 Tax=Timonella sp. A28 TaxID=3442640 RepID=UPI003EC08AF3